jgi:hypothetical protein
MRHNLMTCAICMKAIRHGTRRVWSEAAYGYVHGDCKIKSKKGQLPLDKPSGG